MFEIKGKVNTAICYAKVFEQEAVEQIRRMCDYELTENSHIRIMPDVHVGKGCTIGTTMTVTEGCNVRAEPNSEDDNIIGGLEAGTEIEKLGQEGDWVQIEYEGQTGYVYSGLLE